MGADIAQGINLRLPTCGPEFKSQAHHLLFFHLPTVKFCTVFVTVIVKSTKIRRTEERDEKERVRKQTIYR